MSLRSFIFVLLCACFDICAAKPGCEPVNGSMRLAQIAQDQFQVDYLLDQPISGIVFGRPVVDYRLAAWHVLTPGIKWMVKDGQERLQALNQMFTQLRVRANLYKEWDVDRYVPMSRHSDGGTDVYLGYFLGEALRGSQRCPLRLRVRLRALPGQRVFATAAHLRNPESYVHFGKRKAVRYGGVRAIIDPQVPTWIQQLLHSTIPQANAYYTQAFHRKQHHELLLLFGAGDLNVAGRSIKGGAVAGQLFYKIDGAATKIDTHEARKIMQLQVFHELAHIWQGLPWPQAGVQYDSAWITEGGAEALSLAGLKATGLWSAAEVSSYGAALEKNCPLKQDELLAEAASLKGRMAYDCGYRLFSQFESPAPVIWRCLLDEAMRTGQPYSEQMMTRVMDIAERTSDAHARKLEQ